MTREEGGLSSKGSHERLLVSHSPGLRFEAAVEFEVPLEPFSSSSLFFLMLDCGSIPVNLVLLCP